jgi:hypothetical protein
MAIGKPVLGSPARLMLLAAMVAATPLLARCAAGPYEPPAAATVQCEQNDGVFAQRLVMPNVPPGLMCLEEVDRVNDALFNRVIFDADGYKVGHFRRIETKAPGDVVAVVRLSPSLRTISMLTDHLRFDPARGVIIADLTNREIDLIPTGFPYG